MSEDLNSEARAFDRRIEERIAAGFIPDLQRAIKCTYFYKSFWRDPYFIKLYLGNTLKTFLSLLEEYGGEHLRILDAGCGAGYFSLELARKGHHVIGVDISPKAIKAARQQLKTNPFINGFGSLRYEVKPLDNVNGTFDCILFSGVLHHFKDVESPVQKAINLLADDGLILASEPCHEQWRKEDAAQVALIRALLSLTGYWYEASLGDDLCTGKISLEKYIEDVFIEYVTEQDKHEDGKQSPLDNSSTGEEILDVLRKYTNEKVYILGVSFIYRLLGGLRGKDKETYQIADFLTLYEKYVVSQGYLRPNGFYYLGTKR